RRSRRSARTPLPRAFLPLEAHADRLHRRGNVAFSYRRILLPSWVAPELVAQPMVDVSSCSSGDVGPGKDLHEAVGRAGIHVELGGDARLHETSREVDVFVSEHVDATDDHAGWWQAGQ